MLKANKIAFSPALPAAKRASITKLGMGNFNKIALRFPPSALNILPPATANFFNFVPRTFTATNIKNGVYDFVNMRYVRPEMQSPVIVGIVAGQYAKSLESVALSTIVAQVMTQLRAEWPDLPNPIATAMTKWSTDPYSLGAYSYMAPGSSSADYTEIGRPIYTAAGVPWLQLAGEAAGSWPYPSQVHGAFTAGKKAGDLIVATRTKF